MIAMLFPRFSFVVSTIRVFFFVGSDGAVGSADGFGSSSGRLSDGEFPSSTLFLGAMAGDLPGRFGFEVSHMPVPCSGLLK